MSIATEIEIIDAHAHISFKSFNKDRSAVLKRAKEKKIFIVDSPVTIQGYKKSIKIGESYDNICSTFGFHPLKAHSFDNKILDFIEGNIDKAVAIGEVGLDFRGDFNVQKEIFEKFIKIAKEYEKPIVVHARGLEEKALEILLKNNVEKALFHCFSADAEVARRIVDVGYYISISTNVCYLSNVQKIVGILDLERVLIETDCPYLSPYKDKKRNEPSFIVESIKTIAKIKNLKEKDVAEITKKNAERDFTELIECDWR